MTYFDRSEKKSNYLEHALEMCKCCVVVMKYTKNEPVSRTKLEYVSENVQQLGMNLSSLKGGFRLPKDYIHPEDRDGFIEAVSIASENRSSFTYHVRLVGDDGVLRHVDIRSEYMDYDEDYYLIEYVFQETVIQEVSDNSGCHMESVGLQLTKELLAEDELSEIFGTFARAYGLYSTVVDQNGHSLMPPVGPDAYLGYYYDMFERPENQEFFESLKRSSIMQEEAVFSELPGDGNPESRVSAVPITVNGLYLATWILCAQDRSQASQLRIASREQYHLAELISGFIQRSVYSGQQGDKEREIEKQLEFEYKQKQILSEVRDIIRSDDPNRLYTILKIAAETLDVDYAFYVFRRKNDLKVVNKDSKGKSWSPDGNSLMTMEQMQNLHEGFSEEDQQKILQDGYVVDQENMTNRIRVTVFQGQARAAIIMPIGTGRDPYGRLYFVESRKERIWTDSEVEFARLIGRLLGEAIEYIENEGRRKNASQTLLKIFHQLTIDVFIREDETGKVLFVNDALIRHLGTDITGHDSRRLIPEGREEYESYPGAIHEKEAAPQEIRTWTRYINELGAIYNVTEIPIEWVDGSSATAVLLRQSSE